MIEQDQANSKCGFVTIIGAPNAGKSTLTNLLVGTKVTIVSPKVQTTRSTIRAIMVEDNAQLIFCDTPGIFKAEKTLEKAIVASALEQLSNAGEVLLLIDVTKKNSKANQLIFEILANRSKKILLALNKIDLIAKNDLLPMIAKYEAMGIFSEIFLLSALKDEGVVELKQSLIKRAPVSPFLYPEDQAADIPSKFLAAEITREKLFLELREELPYNLSVETESWQVQPNGSIKIDQVIYVMRHGQKKILIGKKGESLKKIGSASRVELAEIFATKIHLYLHVKVKENWTEDKHMYAHMHLNFPKN